MECVNEARQISEGRMQMTILGRNRAFTVVGVFSLWICVSSSFGETISVAKYGDGTPSRANALAAYNAASAGDTVQFPASGAATWSDTLEVSKAITIDGNGTTLTGGVVMSHGFFYLKDFTSTELVRITNFTFNLNSTSGGDALFFSGLDLTKLRIDHNTFRHGTNAMEVRGCRGVIDHNAFYNCFTMIRFSAGTRAQADASWVSMAAGTSDALFIEDNDFIIDADWTGTVNDQMIDTYNGGKLVVRYNTFDTTNLPAGFPSSICWTIQTHGSAPGGEAYGYWQKSSTTRRGQSVVEIYGNTMTGKKLARLATLRGSVNLVYNNSINSSTSPNIVYMFEEENTTPEWDPLRTSWPAEDQVHNTFIWGNTSNGVAQTASQIGSYDENWIRKDRDYFLHRPATIGEGMTLGKEVFTGANGASGTYPTDGVTYPTQGTMTFIPGVENAYYGYTAYAYPHPLTQNGSLLPPSKLRIRF
jgi:hypothetical protein